jgi:hypothetical protein
MSVLSPVFTAEPRALAQVLEETELHPSYDGQRDQLVALVKAVLPDVVETPARMKRLNNAVGERLLGGPRTWRDVEEARTEFEEIFTTHAANVTRVLEAAALLAFAEEDLARLRTAQEAMERLRSQIFGRWQSYTPADHADALAEVQQGKVRDLDEVIRELQGPAD